MSCDLQIMANLQKKIQNASIHLPQTYPYAFVRAYLYLWLDVHHISNGGTSDSNFRRIYTVRANIMSVSSCSGAHCTASQCSYM